MAQAPPPPSLPVTPDGAGASTPPPAEPSGSDGVSGNSTIPSAPQPASPPVSDSRPGGGFDAPDPFSPQPPLGGSRMAGLPQSELAPTDSIGDKATSGTQSASGSFSIRPSDATVGPAGGGGEPPPASFKRPVPPRPRGRLIALLGGGVLLLLILGGLAFAATRLFFSGDGETPVEPDVLESPTVVRPDATDEWHYACPDRS